MNFVKTKEFKIGIISAISFFILIYGLNYLKGVNLFKPSNYYQIEYKNVSGLEISSPVLIDGFKVGLVTSIEFDYQTNNNVIVEVSLDKKLRVPQGSKMILKPGLMGGAELDLKLNTYVSENHSIGDKLIGEYDNGLMGKLQDNLLPTVEQILPKIDTILTGLQKLVTDSSLIRTMSSMEKTTAQLEKSSLQLNKILSKDVPVMVGNVNTITTDFAAITTDLRKLDLQDTYKELNGTLTNLNAFTQDLNNPNGTIGLLLKDSTLYNNLTNTAESANQLMMDLKQNPKRYVHFSVFGRK